MSSPFFKGFCLLGLLCLWVTPTKQQLAIVQDPNPPILGADVLLKIDGIISGNIRAVAWFQSNRVDPEKFISGRVLNPEVIQKGTIPIANDGATVTSDNALKIPNLKKSDVNYYTVLLTTDKSVETATTIVIFSNASAVSSSVLLLAAVLFSSLRLL